MSSTIASRSSPSLVASLCWLSLPAAALLLSMLYGGFLVPNVLLLYIFGLVLALLLVYLFIAMLAALLHLLCILMIMELLLVVFVVYLLMELVTLLKPSTHMGLVLVLVTEVGITFWALDVTRIDLVSFLFFNINCAVVGWTLIVIQRSFVVNLLAAQLCLVALPVICLPFMSFTMRCLS